MSFALKGFIVLTTLFLSHSLYASTEISSRPILFIHGFNAFGLGENCGSDWSPMEKALATQGFTGQMITVGYYKNDKNCDVLTSPQGTILTHVTDLSKDFAWYVYNKFSQNNIDVDIVTHSLAGLIVRYAMYRVSVADTGYPPFLKVAHVAALAAPFTGYNLLAESCHINIVNFQCDDMFPASSLIQSLKTKEALVPQGLGGTIWSNVGSKADFLDGSDGFVTSKSATSMNVSRAAKTSLPWYRLVFHTLYTHNKVVMSIVGQSLAATVANSRGEVLPLAEENLISAPNGALAPDSSPTNASYGDLKLDNLEFAEDVAPAKIEPNMVNGENQGVRFSKVQPDGIFSKIGIQEGDIVSGCTLENLNAPFEILARLETSANPVTVNLCIIRDGKEFNKQVVVH